MASESDLVRRVDPERLARLALSLVAIPSPTGRTRAAAEHYAAALAALGMAVRLVPDWPGAPAVVARLPGPAGGPALTLSGHLDHVPLPHDPPRLADGVLHGRGAADMKGALAAVAEAVQVLQEAGVRLGGTLQIIAHGLHEWPGGCSEDLAEFCRRGEAGDAAIVCECAHASVGVAQNGLARFALQLWRPGRALHETRADPGTPHPIMAMGGLLVALAGEQARLGSLPPGPAGPERVFIGRVGGGDDAAVMPADCTVEGTRRWAPARSAAEARAELADLGARVAGAAGLRWDLHWQTVRESFATDPEGPLVRAVRAAAAAVSGAEVPLTATPVVADGAVFARTAGIPVVYHGPAGRGIHGAAESVTVAELARAARVYALAACRYLGVLPPG